MKISVALLFLFPSLSIAASQKQIAHCEIGETAYEVYENPESEMPRWPHTIVEVRKSDQRKRTMIARLEANATGAIASVALPKFWDTTSIAGANCTAALIARDEPDSTFIRMSVDGYFMYTMMDPDTATEKINEMVRRCEAFPVTFEMVCETGGAGPLGCRSVQILNRQIEINPPPGC